MMHATDLAERWNLRVLHGRRQWRGNCPICDYRDGFSLTERDGRALLWCSSCQDKDALVALLRGAGRGADDLPHYHATPDADATATRKKAAAARLWAGATTRGLHHTYLAARDLPALGKSIALRFSTNCYHASGTHLPAMLAQVQNAAGDFIGLHRTYLRADGRAKADVEPAKASLGPIWGGAIRLDPLSEEMVIGEGIETSASAGLLLGLPAWAAISAGNLGKGLVLPADARAVVIAADADPPGQRAAAEAAARWQAEGRRVRIATPNHQGQDFNDLLKEARNG